jgi:hypothetical protein
MSPSTDLIRTKAKKSSKSQSAQIADGTLARRGPGLTISQLAKGGAKLMESAATTAFNRFGGPERSRLRIKTFFGEDDDPDKRQAALDELYTVLQHCQQQAVGRIPLPRQHKALRADCYRLLTYARK